jgi:SAM-dependent methyltransferase
MECRICNNIIDEELSKKFISKCCFNQEEIIRFKCPNCDVIFGNQRMLNLNFEELKYEYDELYKTYKEGPSTELELELLKSLSNNPDKTKFYINWGCGGENKTLKIANEMGYNLKGYDITNIESNLVINDLSKVDDGSVDGIFSNNYIEHMQNPIKDWEEMNRKLKLGGLMIHATPCWNYYVEYTRFHLFFLEGKSLQMLVEKTGFEIIEDYPHSVTDRVFTYPDLKNNVKVFKKIKNL